MKIGIDVGGVIMEAGDTDVATAKDIFFTDRYLEATARAHCIETIRKWVDRLGINNVFIVSKCYPKMQRKTMEWFKHFGFFEKTGLLPENVLFCLERHEKARIAKDLALSVFIDDRWTVLKHMLDLEDMKKMFLFDPGPKELEQASSHHKVKIVKDWKTLGEIL